MYGQEAEKSILQLPWIIFKVRDNDYSVNSENVISIVEMPNNIIQVPDVQQYIRGIMDLRGSIIPLIDLKVVFGAKSYKDIINEFSDAIQKVKKDCLDWINELERCIQNEELFTLKTGVRQCGLGKWFYSYNSDDFTINNHLSKLEQPHNMLHDKVKCYIDTLNNDKLTQEEKNNIYSDILYKAKTDFVPKIIDILTDTQSLLKESLKEMIIVIEYNNFKAGIIVDKVNAIENVLDVFEQSEMDDKYYDTRYVTSVGKSEKSNTTVLKLNLDNILSKAAHIDLEEAEKMLHEVK